jgi:hypothetical protein
MHEALATSDIACAILDSVVWSRGDLHALALTCRSFSDHALDHLWVDADLFYLALLMPENLRDINRGEDGNSVVRSYHYPESGVSQPQRSAPHLTHLLAPGYYVNSVSGRCGMVDGSL